MPDISRRLGASAVDSIASLIRIRFKADAY